MRRTIQVFVGETPVRVGVIHYDSQGARESAAFEYASEWLVSPDAFALAPELRLVAGRQFHQRTRDGSVFHDPIADTEPDGWGKSVIVRDHAFLPCARAKRTNDTTSHRARCSARRVAGRGDEHRNERRPCLSERARHLPRRTATEVQCCRRGRNARHRQVSERAGSSERLPKEKCSRCDWPSVPASTRPTRV